MTEQNQPETPQQHLENDLDEGLAETFPASDPVAVGHIEGAEPPPYAVDAADSGPDCDASDPRRTVAVHWWLAQAAVWFGLWVAIDHSSETADLVAGAIAAALGAWLVTTIWLHAGERFAARPGWLRHFISIPWQVARDTVVVLASIFTGEASGKGQVILVPFKRGDETRRNRGRRALVIGAVSTAPNTAVAAAPVDQSVLHVHVLTRPSSPLGGDDPCWPL